MYLFEVFSSLMNEDLLFMSFLVVLGLFLTKVNEKRKIFIFYIIGVSLTTLALKEIFYEERVCITDIVKCPSNSSFPSGHALVSFAMAFFFYRDRDSMLVLLILSLLISFSRLYLGVHNIGDISAGFGFAVFYFSLWWKNGYI